MYTNLRYDERSNTIRLKKYGSKQIESVTYERTFFCKSGIFSTNSKIRVEPTDRVHFITKEKADKVTILDPASNGLFEIAPKDFLYMYDLSPEYQYLLYNESFKWSDQYDVCYLDIETDDSLDPEAAILPILMVTVMYRKKDKDGLPTGDFDTKVFNIMKYPTEQAMLRDFFDWFTRDLFPDVVLGWNVIDYDKAYLVNRAKRLGVRYEHLRFSLIDFIDGIDVIKKKFGYTVMKFTGGMGLHNISTHFLKRGKVDLGMTFGKAFKKDPFKAAEYNVNDVLLVKDLDEMLQLITFLTRIQQVSGVPLRDTFFNSMVIDYMILKRYPNYVFQSRKFVDEYKEYEGGYVLTPPKGVFDNVASFDFSAMYPSIILTFNISPDTKVKEGADYTIDGVGFKKSPDGIFKETIKFLYTERLKLKAALKTMPSKDTNDYKNLDTLQTAYKTILNSVYGVCAYKNFRFFDVDLAASITSMGRKLIKTVKVKIEESQLGQVLYGDTDSVFVKINAPAPAVLDYINTVILPNYVRIYGIEDHYVKVEIADEYERIAFFGKKKTYIGKLKHKDDFYIKGHPVIRYDTPKGISKQMHEIIRRLFAGEKIDIMKYRDPIVEMKNIPDIRIVKRLNKNPEEYKSAPPHLRALYYTAKLIPHFDSNINIVSMLYVKTLDEKLEKTDVLAVNNLDEIPEGFMIDADKYFVCYLIKSMIDTFDVLGFDNVLGLEEYLNSYLTEKDHARIKKYDFKERVDLMDKKVTTVWTKMNKVDKPDKKSKEEPILEEVEEPNEA